jgi:hypothetical protein
MQQAVVVLQGGMTHKKIFMKIDTIDDSLGIRIQTYTQSKMI